MSAKIKILVQVLSRSVELISQPFIHAKYWVRSGKERFFINKLLKALRRKERYQWKWHQVYKQKKLHVRICSINNHKLVFLLFSEISALHLLIEYVCIRMNLHTFVLFYSTIVFFIREKTECSLWLNQFLPFFFFFDFLFSFNLT